MPKDKKNHFFSLLPISTLISEYFLSLILIYSPIFNKIEQFTFSLSLNTSKIIFNVLINVLASNLNSGIDGS